MAFVRINEEFYDHPRHRGADAAEIGLWVAAIAWCNRNQSDDGRIPKSKLSGLVSVRNMRKVVAGLVERGSFIDHPETREYEIRDYADYQLPDKVRDLREKRSTAGKKGAEARWNANGNRMANAITGAMANRCPDTDTDTGTDMSSSNYDDNDMNCVAIPSSSSWSSSEVLDKALDLYVQHSRATYRNPISNPLRFTQSVRRNVITEQGAALTAYLTDHPEATAFEIVEHVLGVTTSDLIRSGVA
jgi:hypothetical protein